jgi:molybdenum cofactor cytidylyltransferase
LAVAGKPVIRVAPYKIRKVGVVSTLLPGLAAKVVDKTLRVTEARLAPAGARIVAERRVPHEQGALAKAVDEVLKRAPNSSCVRGLRHRRSPRRDPGRGRGDRRPDRALRMPVDPGNLMMVGQARGLPIVGAPGCARSPKENGFDWILMRLLAGLPVSREDITGFGRWRAS